MQTITNPYNSNIFSISGNNLFSFFKQLIQENLFEVHNYYKDRLNIVKNKLQAKMQDVYFNNRCWHVRIHVCTFKTFKTQYLIILRVVILARTACRFFFCMETPYYRLTTIPSSLKQCNDTSYTLDDSKFNLFFKLPFPTRFQFI